MTSPTPEAILLSHGFIPDLHEREQDFVRACKEGIDDAVRAFLDIGVSATARREISHETALISAAEGGLTSTMAILIERGADLEGRDGADDTAFRTSLNWNHPDGARFLVSKGCDVEAVNRYGESALAHAIGEQKHEDIELLLELGANAALVTYTPKFGSRSPMRAAIEKSDNDLVRKLLDTKHGKAAPPTMVLDEHGVTLLHEAVRRRMHDLVDELLERGATVDARDRYGLTPLDYALLVDDETLIETLAARDGGPAPLHRSRAGMWKQLKSGEIDEALASMERDDIAVDARDHQHHTPLGVCAKEGRVEGVRRLIARGASVNAEPDTPLSQALTGGHAEIVKLLLEAKAHVVDSRGMSGGMSSAAWSGCLDAVRLVLEASSAEHKLAYGEIVKTAVMQKNVALTKLLAEQGMPLDFPDDNDGRETALMEAVSSWHSHDVVRALVEGGADVNVHVVGNSAHTTVLHKICGHYAWDDEYEPTLRFLLERGARLDVVDWLGNTPWHSTASQHAQRAQLVALLVEQPLDDGVPIAELAKRHCWATLGMFIHAGRSELIWQVLDASAGVTLDPPAGVRTDSVLCEAIEKQDVELVRELVRRGAGVNRMLHYWTTPTINACGKPSREIVEILLAAGGDVNVVGGWGRATSFAAGEHPEHLPLLQAKGARFDERADSALLSAARKGNLASVEFLLANGARVDVRGRYGDTPLCSAIEGGHDAVALKLIDAGASGGFASRNPPETPLTAACKKGRLDIIKALLASGAKLEDQNKEGESALTIITRRKALRTAFADVLAQRGIDVSVPKLERLPAALTTTTPTWDAVYRGDEDAILEDVASKRLDVNARDAWGVTPLMVAVLRRNASLVSRLIEAGADVTLADPAKAQAYDYCGFSRDDEIDELITAHAPAHSFPSMDRLNAQAARSLHADAVREALERGEIAKVANMVRDQTLHPFLGTDGTPILIRAIRLDDEDLVGALLDLGLSPESRDSDGTSALGAALSKGQLDLASKLCDLGATLEPALLATAIENHQDETLEWLLEKGADARALAPHGRCAFHVAIAAAREELVERFLEANATLREVRDRSGQTPLMIAVSDGAARIVDVLLAKGADVNAFDSGGMSALHKAIDARADEIAALLLEHGASWDNVDVHAADAVSARLYLDRQGLDAGWPESAVKGEHGDDHGEGDDHDHDHDHDHDGDDDDEVEQ